MCDICILYGSETGNAEDLSFRIYDEIKLRWSCSCSIANLVDFDPELFPTLKYVILIISTSGNCVFVVLFVRAAVDL